ncbi:MAG TPA: hypothetical protein VGK23_09480 [Methanomassiliicoccales archaeon]|jgi:hypothetical protein
MTIHLLITIDTEIDKSKDWTVSSDQSFTSVTEGIPDKLTPLFAKYGARPTYLLSPEVIRDDDCLSVLKNLKNCELGTHLHGDMIEPFCHKGSMANMSTDNMQSSYTYEIERLKMVNLTALFATRFGYKPTSFRAGRFAAGSNTLKILDELNYKVDSSVTPNVDWKQKEGRANYLSAPDQPYYPKINDLLTPNGNSVLEVPVTILKPANHEKWHVRSIRTISGRIYPLQWLRPSCNTGDGMVQVMRRTAETYADKKEIVLNMMFHSMEIMPGTSPYAAKEKDCQRILGYLEQALAYAKDNKHRFSTLGEMPQYFRKLPRIVAEYDKDGHEVPLRQMDMK